MSARHERIRAAFSGRWPDRIPVLEQSFASSVASEVLGREVTTGSTDVHYAEAEAWLKGDSAHEEFVDKLYEDCVALHRAMDFDILCLPWRMGGRPTRRLEKHTILYGDLDGDYWKVYRFDPSSRTYALAESSEHGSFEEAVQTMRTALEHAPSVTPRPQLNALLTRALAEHGDEFVVAGNSFLAVPMLSGWLEATILEPGLLADYLDLKVEEELTRLEAQKEAGIYLIKGGGDFAFNTGPVYSPEFFEEVMAPRWKRLFDRCRELDLVYVMRSDGNLWPVADSLFGEARPHGYYECDYDAGMHFGELRSRFPELVLMGNVSCRLLIEGTPDEVRRQTLECIEAAAPRVVAASANSVMHGTPVENVLALYETAKSYDVKTHPSAEHAPGSDNEGAS